MLKAGSLTKTSWKLRKKHSSQALRIRPVTVRRERLVTVGLCLVTTFLLIESIRLRMLLGRAVTVAEAFHSSTVECMAILQKVEVYFGENPTRSFRIVEPERGQV